MKKRRHSRRNPAVVVWSRPVGLKLAFAIVDQPGIATQFETALAHFQLHREIQRALKPRFDDNLPASKECVSHPAPLGIQPYRKPGPATKVVAFGGKIVVVGFASGEIPQPKLNHALIKNYSIIGLHWGRYLTEDPALVARCHGDLTRLAEVGAVRPLVSEQVPFEEAASALTRLGAGQTVGRIVVHPPG